MVEIAPEDFETFLEGVREWIDHRQVTEQADYPIRLLELEEFSDIAAFCMQVNIKCSSLETYDVCRQAAMNRIRQLFNLEFKLCCDVCGMAHRQDEISAPER